MPIDERYFERQKEAETKKIRYTHRFFSMLALEGTRFLHYLNEGQYQNWCESKKTAFSRVENALADIINKLPKTNSEQPQWEVSPLFSDDKSEFSSQLERTCIRENAEKTRKVLEQIKKGEIPKQEETEEATKFFYAVCDAYISANSSIEKFK